jgi:hypothetical protein
MLYVDLTQDDNTIAKLVLAECAKYGMVSALKIHRSPTPFALVDMSDYQEALALVAQYGGSAFKTSVLIHLQQLDD